MGIEEAFNAKIEQAIDSLVQEGRLTFSSTPPAFKTEKPAKPEMGQVACNAALVLAKSCGQQPRQVAEMLCAAMQGDALIESIAIAGPGFLNIRVRPAAYALVLNEVHTEGLAYGRSASGSGERVLVEFVSANPTGPLLVSHTRGALLGDVVARLLEATGHRVIREYYINDFGNQVKLFARSVCAAAMGNAPPADGYSGTWVTEVANYLNTHARPLIEHVAANESDDAALGELSRLCVTRMLDGVPGAAETLGIKKTLKRLRVDFDGWFSEESLHRWGRVSSALDRLQRSGFLKTLDDGALVFQMPEGQGEEDKTFTGEKGASKKQAQDSEGGRVVRKHDGKTFTYFASDIAYHEDKVERGYDRLINVLGADHHGYVPRLKNVMSALGLPAERFEPLLFQLVTILRDGQEVRMGKRLGNAITVDELIDEIDAEVEPGAATDALRYFYLSKSANTKVLFDIAVAKKQSFDNEAIYFQYGHARCCSILAEAQRRHGWQAAKLGTNWAQHITRTDELEIVQMLGAFPRVVQDAADSRAPQKLTEYIKQLVMAFQAWYTLSAKQGEPILPLKTRTVEPDWQQSFDVARAKARLGWVEAVRTVFAAGLGLLGIRAPQQMRRSSHAKDEADQGGESLEA